MTKYIFIALAMVLFLNVSSLAVEPIETAPVNNPLGCESATAEGDTMARRGCCSWHGGVCGCGGSRARCCDGSLSPSCGCYYSPDEEPLKEDNAN